MWPQVLSKVLGEVSTSGRTLPVPALVRCDRSGGHIFVMSSSATKPSISAAPPSRSDPPHDEPKIQRGLNPEMVVYVTDPGPRHVATATELREVSVPKPRQRSIGSLHDPTGALRQPLA